MGKANMVRGIDAPQIHTAHTGIPIFCVLATALSGLYTQCLERCIVTPGLETRKMFRRVGKVVLAMSDGRQHPVRTCQSSIPDLLHLMSANCDNCRPLSLVHLLTCDALLQHVHDGFHKPLYLVAKTTDDLEGAEAVQTGTTVSVKVFQSTMTDTLNPRHRNWNRSVVTLDQLLPLVERRTSR